MDLKTRMEVLPCGKCEDMIGCDTCIFVKEAKELYKQIRADAIEECIEYFSKHAHEIYNHVSARDFICDRLEQLRERNK